MRHILRGSWLVSVLVSMAIALSGQSLQPFECNGDFYNVFAKTLEFDDFTPSVLARVTIDVANQVEFTELGRLPTEVNGIGYRVTDNFIYGMTQNNNTILRIGSRGNVEPLRTLTELGSNSYFAADVTPDGNFLVMTGNNQAVLPPQPTNSLVFVDLRDPSYPTEVRTLDGNAFFPDFAFDPFEDRIAYGYDGNTRQLYRIDVATGQITPVGRAGQSVSQFTSMYFDPLGRLFGYGIVNLGLSSSFGLYAIDKFTGAIRALAEGPEANKNDGCSCPYQVTLFEDVQARISVSCTELRLVYTVGNATGQTRTGLSLSEDLPIGFSVVELESNPFGGDATFDNGRVRIDNMSVPVGVDSIVLTIVSDVSTSGIHYMQSSISGLPLALGGSVFSDDPLTTNVPNDQTRVEVRALSTDYEGGGERLCPDETLVFVFDTIAGVSYTVNGIPFDGVYEISTSGDYLFEASSGCISMENGITVIDVDPPEIELPPGTEIELGDSIQIIPFNIVGVDPLVYNWSAVFGDPRISCPQCPEPYVRPFESTLYRLDFSDANGCLISDTIFIRVDSELYYYAPNAFSPNGDNVNDAFKLFSSRPYALRTFAIIDRWGNMLFREEDVRLENMSGWNGSTRGQMLDPGVYLWMAIFQLPDGSEVPAAGDVNLIR